jgi:drug/metabolite transporter (DMT)-like permease
MVSNVRKKNQGLNAALTSAFFLGMAPVFGKMAMVNGLHWAAVVGLRTFMAAILLFVVMLIFKRSFLYIYPAGLLGCLLAGVINGLGSLLYYSALMRVDASLGQMIYSLYPIFVAVWLWLDHQPPSRLTIFRMIMVIPALFLLTNVGNNGVDMVGVLMMLGAAALYALHLPINQRVLYDMPAPTVTLYTLLAMSATVMPAFFLSNFLSPLTFEAWGPLFGLTLVTFLSRLTLFLGVKHIGGAQTALLGLGELLVTLFFSHIWLHDRLEVTQWIGVALLVVILSLFKFEKPGIKKIGAGGWLSWLRPAGLPVDIHLRLRE